MRLAVLTAFSLCLLFNSNALAQNFKSELFKLDPSLAGPSGKTNAEVSAALLPSDKEGVVELAIKMVIPPGANSYSQSKDFAKPTKISVNASGWTALDPVFTADPPAKRSFDKSFKKEVEKLTGTVIFKRRYLAPSAVDVSTASLSGEVSYLLCKESCVPHKEQFTASFDGSGTFLAQSAPPLIEELSPPPVMEVDNPPNFLEAMQQPPPEQVAPPELIAPPASASSAFQYAYQITPARKLQGQLVDDPVELQFELSDTPVDGKVIVAITMTIGDNWSTYGLEKAVEEQIERPTLIEINATNLQPVGDISSTPSPERHETKLGGETIATNAHEGQVTWKQKFAVIDEAPYGVTGKITYQICETGKSCQRPNQVDFSLGTTQSSDMIATASAITGSYFDVESEAETIPQATPTDEITTLSGALGTAFLVGLILNIMPCILPVLAIKILSFVQQSGESRSRAILLNVSYTAGVVAVFMALAVITIVLKSSLSGMYQNSTFMIVMAGVVFTMGLSLFGVFELPVPGILPSANEHKEGYLGAFSTGIIATILGTPCIGPFIAPVILFCIQQNAPTVFLVFATMGVGMASPFLITAIFPALVNWLPKPGMWMVYFKQFSGFLMMGTVIFLLHSVDDEMQLPVILLFLAIALCLWMMANLVNTNATTRKKYMTYAASLIVSAPIFLFGLWQMGLFSHNELPWQPFTEESLIANRKEGKPMLIDFTADWCAICKWNEAFSLNTKPTVDFVEEHGIVTIVADYTKESDEIRKWLNHFGQDSVPAHDHRPCG